MNKNRFAKQLLVAAGIFFLCAAPGLGREQNSLPAEAPSPHTPPPMARPRKNAPPPDFYAGLTFTDEQKTKIDQIRQNGKSHLEAVAKAQSLSPEAKDAMLRGYQRIENQQIFEVLTTEQRAEVRKRILAWRAATRPSQPPSQQQPQQKKPD